MAHNVLDFSLEHFGPASEPELYSAVNDAGVRELEGFLEAYRVFAGSGEGVFPRLSPSTVRPYLPYVYKPDWTVGGLQLDFDTLRTDDAEWRIADAIKHRLLYCHSIALDDPLGHLLALTTAQIQMGQGDSGRRALLRFVNLLLHFGPLLRSHIVCLLPDRSYSAESVQRFRRRDELARVLEQSTNYDPREYIDAAPEELRSDLKARELFDQTLLRRVATSLASSRIAIGLEAILDAPDKISLYLPFRADVEMLKSNTQLSGDVAAGGFSDRESWLLNELVDLEMPGLAELHPSVLIEIRTGVEFSEWRQALSNALLTANALPGTLWNRDLEIKRTVREQLTESWKRLEAQLGKSPVMAGLKKGRTSIIVGLVALGISALIDPSKLTTAAIAGLVASSTTATVIDALETGRPSSRENAAIGHYVAALK
jgi:hypothetical protein